MRSTPNAEVHLPVAPADFQLLLALSQGDSYGYALLRCMGEQSGGVVRPEIGSLYRMLARLTAAGLVLEVGDHTPAGDSPGRPRRYYRLSTLGLEVLEAEVRRLQTLLGRAGELVGRGVRS